MKIVKLSGSQTIALANLGVDVDADVLIPSGKGAGNYSFCAFCYHQRFEIVEGEVQKVCGHPNVEVGISTAECFYRHTEEGLDEVPDRSDDSSRDYTVTGDGGNLSASQDIQTGGVDTVQTRSSGNQRDESRDADPNQVGDVLSQGYSQIEEEL